MVLRQKFPPVFRWMCVTLQWEAALLTTSPLAFRMVFSHQCGCMLLLIGLAQPASSETSANEVDSILLSPEEASLRLDIAESLETSGQFDQALVNYEAVIRGGVTGFQFQRALYGKASTCVKAGCTMDAAESIHLLTSRFPDSSFTTAAGVLKAQLDQVDPAPAQALTASESQAAAMVEGARQQARAGDLDQAIATLEYVTGKHPGTASALRANDTKGHLLLRRTQRAEAITAFQGILDQVAATAPKSRIVQMARMRLAALYRTSKRTEDRRVALAHYQEVAADPESPFMSQATMESIGLEIELLPWSARLARTIAPEQWNQIRRRCRAVLELPEARPADRIRADLFILESYAWQGDSESAANHGLQLLGRYDPRQFRQEIATVRFFLGEELQKLERFQEALDQFRQVIAAYPIENEIWPRMDHLPRTLFRIWECLRRMSAPESETTAAAEALRTRFPLSPYAEHIQIVTRQEKRAKSRAKEVKADAR